MHTKIVTLLALSLAAGWLSSSAQAAPRGSTGPRCPDVIRPEKPRSASNIPKDYTLVAYFGKIAILVQRMSVHSLVAMHGMPSA